MSGRRRAGHSTVVAYLALALSLGLGGAWAAEKIGSRDIARNAVKAKHIGKRQVKQRHIAGGGVGRRQLADNVGDLFVGADRVLYGRVHSDEDEALLFRWPGTGVEVRSRDVSDPDGPYEFRIHNTNDPGGPSFWVLEEGGGTSLDPGDRDKKGGLFGANLLLVENNGPAGRMMSLRCFANVLAGGDDGYLQCIGITAGDPGG